MGGVASAVSSAVHTVASASGSVTKAIATPFKAAAPIVSNIPIVGKTVGGALQSVGQVATDAGNLQQGNSAGNVSGDLGNLAKNGAIVGASIATGGAFGVAAGVGTSALLSGGMGGAGASSAADAIGSAYGIPDLGGLLGAVTGNNNPISPIGSTPANLGPYPFPPAYDSGAAVLTPSAGISTATVLLIGAALAIGFFVLKGRKK